MCGGRDNSIFSSLAPSETLIEFPWHPQPVISSPAFGVAMEMASFVCWPMRYNILNRQNGLIRTAEVSFLHKPALMEFALSQVWFLQMEMRIFCAPVAGVFHSLSPSLTSPLSPVPSRDLFNGKASRVNINIRSAERGNVKLSLFCCLLWMANAPSFGVHVVSFSISFPSQFFFFNCITHLSFYYLCQCCFFMLHLFYRLLSVAFASRPNSMWCNKASVLF